MKPNKGPYKPTLILHGGAGNVTRKALPPALYEQYRESLQEYLTSTNDLLQSGANAIEAACHAVCKMEDNPLFNCGRGSVFTIEGGIEMEASLMVASVNSFTTSTSSTAAEQQDRVGLTGRTKKCAAVSMIKNTRHPILLAREVLGMPEHEGHGRSQVNTDHHVDKANMHCHLSGSWVEDWGFRQRGLERKGRKWFWTRKRWEEHRKGLGRDVSDRSWLRQLGRGENEFTNGNNACTEDEFDTDSSESSMGVFGNVEEVPSQGTVGAVCMDSWGNLCVATSTGGLTNKRTGRIGDTPTVGAGFWAESWTEETNIAEVPMPYSIMGSVLDAARQSTRFWIGDCLSSSSYHNLDAQNTVNSGSCDNKAKILVKQQIRWSHEMNACPNNITSPNRDANTPIRYRAVAMSGTGNGDSFLRTNATRTAAAISRFNNSSTLQQSITKIAGPGGELQRSAGERWQKTGEGEGGIIGIELVLCQDSSGLTAQADIAFDFNCNGMWRAYYETDSHGQATPRVMVFRNEYSV